MISCKREKIQIPTNGSGSILSETTPLDEASKKIMEGVYNIIAGTGRFGDNAVVLWNDDIMSVFYGNGCYMVLKAGYLDSVIFFEGYWRYAYNNETGLVNFHIKSNEGGRDIILGKTNHGNIIVKGAFGSSGNNLDQLYEMSFTRDFSQTVKDKKYEIIAHRSGGRTSDNLPFSENSIPMIKFTEHFGSSGIEIDVRCTKDGVPILYHDPDINDRLTLKGPLTGPVKDFTWLQLFYFVKLIHGERIPTLENALDVVIDSTDLRFVWLDMKVGSSDMATVINIQKNALAKAQQQGRDLKIYIGLPSSDVMNDFMNQPDYKNIPSLCELTLEDVSMVNALAWGPRWTEGLQPENVDAIHAQGKKAYCWTIDDIPYIQQYIDEGNFDGLLSNYPSIVAYYSYIK